jgi:hypothetical protein
VDAGLPGFNKLVESYQKKKKSIRRKISSREKKGMRDRELKYKLSVPQKFQKVRLRDV